MDRAEFSKRDMDPHGLRIFRVVIARLEGGAIRIGRPGAGQRGLNCLTGGGHDSNVQPCDRDFVAGLHTRVLAFGTKLGINLLEEMVSRLPGLRIGTVIYELLDGYL